MSHYIVAAGLYAKSYACLAAKGFQLHWQSALPGKCANVKRASKTQFTCPERGRNPTPSCSAASV
jgi:hypothetical protein